MAGGTVKQENDAGHPPLSRHRGQFRELKDLCQSLYGFDSNRSIVLRVFPSLLRVFRPYESEITTIQEILLFRRPVLLGVIISGILVITCFIHFFDCGFFATLTLIPIIYYIVVVAVAFNRQRFGELFFPPLASGPPDLSNRVRTIAELAAVIKSIEAAFPQSPKGSLKAVISGVFLMMLAIVLRHTKMLFFNVIVILAALLLPGILLLPPVYVVWKPFAQKWISRHKQD